MMPAASRHRARLTALTTLAAVALTAGSVLLRSAGEARPTPLLGRGGGGGGTGSGGGFPTAARVGEPSAGDARVAAPRPVPLAVGNAANGSATRGWLVGHFLPPGSPAASRHVEVKWSAHAAGAANDGGVAANTVGTSMALLVRGHHRLLFPELPADGEAAPAVGGGGATAAASRVGRVVDLVKEGDYVLWAPGVAHTWVAVEDSAVVTVRWPSLGGDQVAVGSSVGTEAGE